MAENYKSEVIMRLRHSGHRQRLIFIVLNITNTRTFDFLNYGIFVSNEDASK